MARILAPLWLAGSTRFAGIERRRAVIVAILLVLMLAMAFVALHPLHDDTPAAPTYEGVIGGLRAGGDYYTLTADMLRAGGYPLRPFVAFRLPVHAVVQAALPPIVAIVLLHLLAIGVGCAWWIQLRPMMARLPARLSGAILLAVGLFAFVESGGSFAHQTWAALLVALALAVRTPERWATSVALGLIAMLVLESAALFALVMAVFAWREGARREVAGWAVALLAFALVLVAHGWGVAHVVGPLDPAASGWLEPNGRFFGAVIDATALSVVPWIVAAPLAVLAIFGWTAWRDPLAARMLALVTVSAVAAALVAQPWAALPAPLLLIGLVFAPDAVRDLAAALLDRRRVRVQRVSQ